jgi:lipopolysaccharide export system protein LptA
MHADEVTLFLGGTNELKRIVAIGNVAVTNELRSGTCAKATYNKALSRVILYGDEAKGITAKLNDNGKRKSQVEGRKITFWIDTEQVEVDGSVITVDVGNGDMKDSAKRFLGN